MTARKAPPMADAGPTLATLDITTITLGEMAAVEMESGRDFQALVKAGSATRKMVALYIHETRQASATGAPAPSWRSLADRRPLDSRSST